MTLTFRAAYGSATDEVAVPSGTQVGDLMILARLEYNMPDPPTSFTEDTDVAADGWTFIEGSAARSFVGGQGAVNVRHYWKVHDGSTLTSSYAASGGGPPYASSGIVSIQGFDFTGVDIAAWLDSLTVLTRDAATRRIPEITTTVDGTIGVAFIAAWDNVPGAISGWTDRADIRTESNAYTREFATAGTYATQSDGTDAGPWITTVVTVKPLPTSITDDFNGYAQDADLDTTTNWETFQDGGTGVMRIDEHDDHSNGSKVVDLSTTGAQAAIYQTPLSSAEHYAQVDGFIDIAANTGNEVGVIVRGNQATYDGAFDGYLGLFHQTAGAVTQGVIYRVDNGVRTQIGISGNIDNTAYGDRDTKRLVRLTVQGSALSLTIGGTEVATATDATYSTGRYVGAYLKRNESSTDSQPFYDDFNAGPAPVVGRSSSTPTTSDTQTVTSASFTPRGNSLLLVFAAGQLNLDPGARDLPASPITGTGGLSFTERESYEGTATPKYSAGADYRLNGGMFTAPVGASPAAQTVTFDPTTDATTGWHSLIVADVLGFDNIIQTAKNSTTENNGSDSVSLAVTLGATPAVGSLVLVNFASQADQGTGFTAPTMGGQAMTQMFSQNGAYTQGGVWYRIIDGSESNATIICSDVGNSVGGAIAFAVEMGDPPPATEPGAPTALVAARGNTQATLNWTAPASDGGSAITDYEYRQSTNAGVDWSAAISTADTDTTEIIAGLTNGTEYIFQVRAVNAIGAGAWSASSNAVTPAVIVPFTFVPDTVATTTSRNGDLPTDKWAVSRMDGELDTDPVRGIEGDWPIYRAGANANASPGDIQINTTDELLQIACSFINYGETQAWALPLLDFAAADGVQVVMVLPATTSVLQAYPVLHIGADHYGWAGLYADNGKTALMLYGLSIQFFSHTTGPRVMQSNNSTETTLTPTTQNPWTSGTRNIRLKLTSTRLEVYDLTGAVVLWEGAHALGFTTGTLALATHNHASDKYDGVWGNDPNRVTSPYYRFGAVNAEIASRADTIVGMVPNANGTTDTAGGFNIGYDVPTGGSAALPFTLASLGSSARLTALIKVQPAWSGTIDYRINGGTWTACTLYTANSEATIVRLIAQSVPLTDLDAGANTIEFRCSTEDGYGPWVSNVNLFTWDIAEVPSTGWRLTMAGDQTLTMAGDFVFLMSGEPAGVGDTLVQVFNGSSFVGKPTYLHDGSTFVPLPMTVL